MANLVIQVILELAEQADILDMENLVIVGTVAYLDILDMENLVIQVILG
ncbi:MAG: hypothetical protein ACE14V_16730 [bacterium]